ncbi:MAG: hypothetical protein HY243_09400 [Proteobacteria bacterium]|nr:hypothetical protein [Pseudomonadota bacterium]
MSTQFHRLLRNTSYLVWLSVLLPVMIDALQVHRSQALSKSGLWIALWLMFGVALVVGARAAATPLRTRLTMFGLQTAAALAMTWLRPDFYVGFLLIIIAWQLAIFLPVRIAAGWVLAQAALLFLVLSPICADGCGWVASTVYFAFQVFFVVTVLLVKKEWEARLEQSRTADELGAAQALLVERSRSQERLRLSQELHDVMGHRLTALAINLEIGLNSRQAEEREDAIGKARNVAQDMIADVREVVGALRRTDGTQGLDFAKALETLAHNAPELEVHVSAPAGIRLEDPEQAHAFLRGAQEIITNTLKHAQARNLWIDVTFDSGRLMMRAADDGKTAPANHFDAGTAGIGLAGMRERFLRLGGGVEVSSFVGQGFTVQAWLPLMSAVSTS